MSGMETKIVTDAVRTSAKAVETGMKKIWSILEAAEHKTSPSEALSPQGVRAIQGFDPRPQG